MSLLGGCEVVSPDVPLDDRVRGGGKRHAVVVHGENLAVQGHARPPVVNLVKPRFGLPKDERQVIEGGFDREVVEAGAVRCGQEGILFHNLFGLVTG